MQISGCRDDETSVDTPHLSADRLNRGALTFSLAAAVEEGVATRGVGGFSYRDVWRGILAKMHAHDIRQVPQLSSLAKFNIDSPFML